MLSFSTASLVCAGVCSQLLHAAVVSGTIYTLEGQSRRPADGVRIVARSADGKEILQAVETDASGHYALADLPGASIRISATKKGYVARRAGGGDANFLLDLTAVASPVNQDFELLTGGVITGRVSDVHAEPLKNVRIELRRAGGSDASPARAVTDDNGVYRAFGLEPGRYIVLARRDEPDAAPLYFPGRNDADQAQPIDVGAGTETEGIDLRLGKAPQVTDVIVLEPARKLSATAAAPPARGLSEEVLGSISGHVLSGQTGELLTSASVRLSSIVDGKLITESTSTGPGGAFLFDRVTPGAYTLSSDKAGYALFNLTRQIVLAEKQSRTGVEIKLNRRPAISGRIQDREGRPVVGASVEVYRLRWLRGRRIADSAGAVTTDDRGRYRVTILQPGSYIVGASKPTPADGFPKGELDLGSGRTFYPSTTHAAQAVALNARYGQELTEINLDVVPQETFSVSGVVADAEAGGACLTCVIRAVSLEESYGFTQAQSGVAPNGTYTVRGLMPGSYRIIVEKNSPGRRLVSSQVLEITNRNLTGLDVLAGVARGVSGRVVFESEPPADPSADPKPDLRGGMQIVFTTPEGIGALENARVGTDRTFQFSGLSSEDYVVQIAGLPQGGYLKAIRVAGRELPSPDVDLRQDGPLGPVDLVVSFNSAKIAGQVKIPEAGRDEPAPVNARVTLFPNDNQSPYLTSVRARTGPDGSFTLSGIAPGSYTAFAVFQDTTLNLEDPLVRKQLENYGKAVDLDSGKTAVFELRLTPDDKQ